MNATARELRHAARRLLSRPGYTALSLAVLGLGLAAMLFLLGAVNGMVLEPLPFPEADRLVAIGYERDSGIGIGDLDSADYATLKRELRGVDAFAVYGEATVNLSLDSGPVRYDGVLISAELLPLLGVRPILGRAFGAEDDQPGAPLTVLLGERVWRNAFGADPAVIGKPVRANGEAATIIGVLPADFAFPRIGQVYVPRRLAPGDEFGAETVARLAPGVGLAQLRAELTTVAERLGAELSGQRDERRVIAKPLKFRLVNELTRGLVWMMFSAGVLVLLLACANVANLQLAQGLARSRELAIRSALGASRGRLLRELLAESLLLSLTAAAIALPLAHLGGQWVLDVLVANDDAPAYYVQFGIDARMAGFAVLAALLSTFLVGWIPAWRASKADVQQALRDGDKGSAGGGFARFVRGLVVAEIALTVVLLVGAGMFIRGLNQVLAFDHGTSVDPQRILTGRVAVFREQYPTPEAQAQFFERVVQRLRSDAEVEAASVATALPGTMSGGGDFVAAAGEAKPAGGHPFAIVGHVDEHFAEVYGLRLLQGRFIEARDTADAERVAVVDQRLAQALWPGRDALGQTLIVDPQGEPERLRVIGVVAGLHLEDADDPVRPTFLVPFRQYPARFATIAVRPRGDALAFAPQLAAAVRAEDADTPVYWLRTQQKAMEMARVGVVVLTQVFGAVGGLALLLAAAGLYGVLAFAVTQRTREIGIRRAIGASHGGIVASVGQRVLWQVALGLGLGVLCGLPWSKLLENDVLRTRGLDIAVFGSVLLLVIAVAVLASLVPLRRALRVDPIIALRYE